MYLSSIQNNSVLNKTFAHSRWNLIWLIIIVYYVQFPSRSFRPCLPLIHVRKQWCERETSKNTETPSENKSSANIEYRIPNTVHRTPYTHRPSMLLCIADFHAISMQCIKERHKTKRMDLVVDGRPTPMVHHTVGFVQPTAMPVLLTETEYSKHTPLTH